MVAPASQFPGGVDEVVKHVFDEKSWVALVGKLFTTSILQKLECSHLPSKRQRIKCPPFLCRPAESILQPEASNHRLRS